MLSGVEANETQKSTFYTMPNFRALIRTFFRAYNGYTIFKAKPKPIIMNFRLYKKLAASADNQEASSSSKKQNKT